MNAHPASLIDAVSRSNVVPFIGAGLSIQSGLPSWSALLRDLIADMRSNYGLGDQLLDLYESGMISNIDTPTLHNIISGSNYPLLRYLKQRIDVPCKPTRVHSLLRDFHFGTIITTNYDTLIEKSLDEAQLAYNVIWKPEHLRFYNEAKCLQIIKMHGHISDVDSCVVSSADYANYRNRNRLLFTFVQSIFLSRTVLFLGFSLKDPNVAGLLEEIRASGAFSLREHFAVLSEPESEQIQLLKKDGITVLPIGDSNKTLSFWNWLKELHSQSKPVIRGHYEKALHYNDALEAQYKTLLPGEVIRMRAALGMISNPKEVDPNNIIYGSPQQDELEIKMGNLLRRFLSADRRNIYRTIISIDPMEQHRKGYSHQSMLSRLTTMLEFLDEFSDQIQIAHSSLPVNVNHVIVHDQISFVGFKWRVQSGMSLLRSTSNRWIVRSELEAFDMDFEEIQEENKNTAKLLKIDIGSSTWMTELSRLLISQAISLAQTQLNIGLSSS